MVKDQKYDDFKDNFKDGLEVLKKSYTKYD